MAVYPCDWSAHRYPGPQRSAYISIAGNDQVDSYKLRLCERHLNDTLAIVREHLALVDEDSVSSSSCETCGKDKDVAVFVKLYGNKTEPVDYAADFCVPCAAELGKLLKISTKRPLAAR